MNHDKLAAACHKMLDEIQRWEEFSRTPQGEDSHPLHDQEEDERMEALTNAREALFTATINEFDCIHSTMWAVVQLTERTTQLHEEEE